MTGLLDSVLSALDAPGAYTRGLLAGSPGERVDGRGLLESWGVLGQNTPGLDFGDVLGFGAGILTDPLTYASGGTGLLAKALGKSDDAARLFSAASDLPPTLTGGWGAMDDLARAAPAGNLDQLALGYTPRPLLEGRRLMPDDFAATTVAARVGGDASGPIRLYHGSPWGPVLTPDPSRWKSADDLLFGPGHYMTENPGVASSYARGDGIGVMRRSMTDAEVAAKYPVGQVVQEYGTGGVVVDSLDKNEWGNWVVRGRLADTNRPHNFLVSDEVYTRPTPAVTSYYLNTQKPFDMATGELSRDDAIKILEKLRALDPTNVPIKQELDDAFAGFHNSDPESFYERLAMDTSKAHINQALQQAGYDAIRHVGGGRAGGGKTLHDVWIALNPEQVYEPFLESQVRGKWM